LFRQTPDVNTSEVDLSAENSYTRYLNSDGTSYTRRQPSINFNAHAATQAEDGTPLDDFVWLHGRSLADLPSEQDLAARVRSLAGRLKDLRAASTLENYNGPVLAESDAAAQLFRLEFLPSLLGTRPLSPICPTTNRWPTNSIIRLSIRSALAVLPDFLSVTDNPTLAEFWRNQVGRLLQDG